MSDVSAVLHGAAARTPSPFADHDEVARGAEGVIYRLPLGDVAKVFFDKMADDRIDREYRHSAFAHGGGIPTWKVERVVREAGQRYIVGSFENGVRLSSAIRRRPDRAAAMMRELGALHARIHALPAGNAVRCEQPDPAAALAAMSPFVSRDALQDIRAVMAGSETGFCHADLSLTNILSQDGRLTVLDWARSGAGPVTADVARTCAFILAARHRKAVPEFVAMAFRRRLVRIYLEGYAAATGRSIREIRIWTAVILARKLDRSLPQARLAAIRRETVRMCADLYGSSRRDGSAAAATSAPGV